MIISKGISFTEDPPLFEALQNRGKELLLSVSRRLMRSYRFPFALLITCDRAEVIAQADGPIEVLERALGLNPAKVREYRYSYEGEEALLRLFMLSAGVLSPLFGEDTIQGQMIDAAASMPEEMRNAFIGFGMEDEPLERSQTLDYVLSSVDLVLF